MEAQVLTKTFYKNFLFNWSNSPPMLDYLIKKKCGAKTDLSLSARIITECEFTKLCVNIYSHVELH